MPEGDTVWRAARRLHGALAGHRLTVADLRHPRWATVNLVDWVVTDVVSRGKHLLMRMTAEGRARTTVHTHLGMDGSWWLYRAGEPWRGGQSHQIRAVFGTSSLTAVGYRLADLTVVPTAEEDKLVGHLGPDLLAADFNPDEAVRRLASQPLRPIGEAVLDQRNLAGIGNLYRAELLFLRGVSPWTPVGEVPDLRGLVELAVRLLDANRHRPEQSTTGALRRDARHWVYDRAGQPCRRCGTRVRTANLGDEVAARRAYWCPQCQPGPGPEH